jgi:hypothetical protein
MPTKMGPDRTIIILCMDLLQSVSSTGPPSSVYKDEVYRKPDINPDPLPAGGVRRSNFTGQEPGRATRKPHRRSTVGSRQQGKPTN